MSDSPGEDAREIEELFETAAGMGHGPTRIGLLEEAVRRADMLRDEAIAYNARDRLMSAAAFGGRPDLLLVAFAWCLAYADAHPDRCDERRLLWKYKWVISLLCQFPSIGREQILAAMEDFSHRVERGGYSRHCIESARLRVALNAGDADDAKVAEALLAQAPRDALSDCVACVLNNRVRFLALVGDDELAVKRAEKIRKGLLRCEAIPHSTYAGLLTPLFRLGRLAEAMECHRRGYRLIQRNPAFLHEVHCHIVFLTVTANTIKAKQLFARHLAWLEQSSSPYDRMFFHFSGVTLFKSLCQAGARPSKLRLPSAAPAARPDGKYAPQVVYEWVNESAQELAQQFDERNGNSRLCDLLATYRKLPDDVRPFPLSSKKPDPLCE